MSAEWQEILKQSAGWDPESLSGILLNLADARKEKRHFVVTCAGSGQNVLPSDDNLESFAKAFDLDSYTVRQRLLLPAPRIWRVCSTRQKAFEWSEWMKKLGVAAFPLEDSRMQNLRFVSAEVLDFQKAGLFLKMNQKELLVSWGDVSVIARGMLQFGRIRSTTRDGFSAALKKEHEGPTSERFPVEFFDLHLVGKRDVVRLVDTGFQQIGKKIMEPRIRKHLKKSTTADVFRKLHPHAPFCDQFDAAAGAYGDSLRTVLFRTEIDTGSGPGNLVTGSRLNHVTIDEKNPLPLFDLYSVLCRYEFKSSARQDR